MQCHYTSSYKRELEGRDKQQSKKGFLKGGRGREEGRKFFCLYHDLNCTREQEHKELLRTLFLVGKEQTGVGVGRIAILSRILKT